MQQAPAAQVPGVYRKRVGDMVVTALNDGILNITFDIVTGIDAAKAEAALTASFRPGHPVVTINAFVIHHAGKVILIDTGAGSNFGDQAGHHPQALALAGVAPGDVDLILMTHLHPDHAGGLTGADGQAVFPNAELLVHEKDIAFWLETANPPAEMAPYFKGAQAAVAPYRKRLRPITSGEVAPGIIAEPLPGHTPGHTGYLLQSGADALLIWADIVHLPSLQSRHPEACMAFDIDPEQAKAQRLRMFDKVSTDRLLVSGAHMDFPTLAHLERTNGHYAFVPDVWRPAV